MNEITLSDDERAVMKALASHNPSHWVKNTKLLCETGVKNDYYLKLALHSLQLKALIGRAYRRGGWFMTAGDHEKLRQL